MCPVIPATLSCDYDCHQFHKNVKNIFDTEFQVFPFFNYILFWTKPYFNVSEKKKYIYIYFLIDMWSPSKIRMFLVIWIKIKYVKQS